MSKTRNLPLDAPIVTGNAKAAVNALAGGHGRIDAPTVDVVDLHFDPRDNPRPLYPDRVRRLADLMKANGYDKKKPIGCIVKKVDGQDRIFVYEGQHRYHAAKLAIQEGVALGRIPIVIDDAKWVSPANLIYAGVNANDSKDLTPLELGAAIVELERLGESNARIREKLGVTGQTIRDVMLLINSPAELHRLVRTGIVAGTLAIEEIRAHGPDKALERLLNAAHKAKSAGKEKVTKKALAKPASDKIAPSQAKQLLQGLRAVSNDPSFSLLDMGVTTLVARLLDDFPAELSTRPRETPPATTSTVVPWETLKCPGKGVVADIRIGRCGEDRFIVASTAQIGTGGFAEPLKFAAIERGDYFSKPEQAIAAGIVRIQNFARKPENQAAKNVTAINRWLDSLVKGNGEIEKFVVLQSTISSKRAGLHPATAWPFPTGDRRAS